MFNFFLKIPLNFIFEKFWRMFKIFVQILYKHFKIFQNVLMSTFLLNVLLPEPKFWRRIAVQDLSMKSCPMSPSRIKILEFHGIDTPVQQN